MLLKNVLRALSAGLALMAGGMMVLGCGEDLDYGGGGDGSGGTTDPCAGTGAGSTACCADQPNHTSCNSGSTRYCYWPASGEDPEACVEIGGAYCNAASCATEAGCTSNSGYISSSSTCADVAGGVKYCDYGPPATVDGYIVGGCHPLPFGQTACDGGTLVTVCPNYPPPVAGGYCDYGFGNCIPSSQAACTVDGAFKASCTDAGGGYCDFGSGDEYGRGGCFFKAIFPVTNPGANGNAGRPNGGCENWSSAVTQEECIASNRDNTCIADPTKPHLWGGPGANTTQCTGPWQN